ncbi:MAG: head-tail connector protein [Novosphingobium sp.]
MWFPAPDAEPVTLDEAKAQLRILGSEQDALISRLISAARAYCEVYTGQLFASRDLELASESFAGLARLPVSPVTAVTSIGYVDSAGEAQTLDTSVYEARLDEYPASIVLAPGQSWPATQSGSRIAVNLTAGRAPEDVKHAILLHVAQNFEQVENGAVERWTAVDCLLANHRVYL